MARKPLALALVPLLAACGSDPVADPGPRTTDPTPIVCEDGPGYADAEVEARYVGPVRARILDTEGEPPSVDILAQVCGVNFGNNVCINGSVESDGSVVVPTDNEIPEPAFKYGDGLVYGKLAILLPEPADDLNLGSLVLPKLPSEGTPVSPGGRTVSNGVGLELETGTEIDLDPLFYRTPEEQAFRATELDRDLIPAGVDHDNDLEQLFLLAPLDMSFCPPAKLDFPNSRGFAAGTEVEFLLEGFDIDEQPYAPYGDWAVVAEGVVDASGERIVTTSGGFPILSNVGVRPK